MLIMTRNLFEPTIFFKGYHLNINKKVLSKNSFTVPTLVNVLIKTYIWYNRLLHHTPHIECSCHWKFWLPSKYRFIIRKMIRNTYKSSCSNCSMESESPKITFASSKSNIKCLIRIAKLENYILYTVNTVYSENCFYSL